MFDQEQAVLVEDALDFRDAGCATLPVGRLNEGLFVRRSQRFAQELEGVFDPRRMGGKRLEFDVGKSRS